VAPVEYGQFSVEEFRRIAGVGPMKMKRLTTAAMAFVGTMWLALYISTAQATPCLIVTLTGTQGGPQSFNGLAGAGTLVR
jgi:ribonuclease Z